MNKIFQRKNILLMMKAYGSHKTQIATLAFFGLLNGFFEGIGVNVLIPLFSIVTKKQTNDDSITNFFNSFFQFIHVEMNLINLLILVCILFFGKAGILIICNYLNFKITADYEKSARSHLLKITFASKWSHLLQQKIGHLENHLFTDIKQSSALLQAISGSLITITSLVVYLFIAFKISFVITGITIISGMFLFFILRSFVKKTREASIRTVSLNKDIAHFINQNIMGMKTIKALNVEDSLALRGNKFFNKLRNLKIRSLLLNHLGVAFIQPVSIIFIAFTFAFTYNNSNYNFAAILVIMYLIQRIFLYVNQLQTLYQKVAEFIPYLESVVNYEDETIQQGETRIAKKPFIFTKEMTFENVSFSYNENTMILSNLSFFVKKGEMVGFIGPSGTGKTTVVDLILRLFEPNFGKICIDGVSMEEISLSEWRKNIGYVSQDIFLLNDTIENNIRFYQSEITLEEIIQSLKDAALWDFVDSLPDGLQTVIGERGVLLSAGQRQRIVIARILARHPKFLILDEATSALDNESEFHIQQVIQKLKGKVTIIVIAHRLSTVMDCDRLIVLEKGKVLEQGVPKELLKDSSSYFFKMNNI